DPHHRELLGAPTGVPLTRLTGRVLRERSRDLREPFGRIVEHATDQEYVVILRPARAGGPRVAEVRLEPPAADVQVRVLLVVLAVEDVAARRPDAAREHAIVRLTGLEQVA